MRKKLTERKKKWIERTVDNDRSYKAIVYNRAFVCIFCVLTQLAFLVALLLLSDYGVLWQLVVGVVSVLSVIYLEGRQNRYPTRTLWIILLLVAPFVGLPLYLLYGDGKSAALLKRRFDQAAKKLPRLPQGVPQQGRVGGVSRILEKLGYPTYEDGDVTYYSTGEEFFEAAKESIRSAKKFVFLEYFILSGGKLWSEILKLLLQKAEEGVQIKIIYDDFGSIVCLPPRYAGYLESLHQNIECLAFNKVYPIFTARYNHRDHKKILVVDGKVGFTGGANVADEYINAKKRFGYWKDTGVKITGSAVQTLTKTFLETWLACKDAKLDVAPYFEISPKSANSEKDKKEKADDRIDAEKNSADGAKFTEAEKDTAETVKAEKDRTETVKAIAAYADTPLDNVNLSESVYMEMIHRATDTLYITTPYLVLDDHLRMALATAAARGVDVRIITPGIPDKKAVYRLTRANYYGLLRAGVRIYEYTPGFIHSKMTYSDGAVAIGTANYDYRSLYLHFENMVYFRGGRATDDVKTDFEMLFTVSRERTLANFKRGFFGRTFDTVLRIFEPLL